MELLKLNDAAHELGISYPTIKQWIYHRKIKSVRTAGAITSTSTTSRQVQFALKLLW